MRTYYLIRHSMTAGNQKKRYIGRTDESLCEEGIRLLSELQMPEAERIYVSPMKRCLQTAQILYPGQPYRIVEDFRECDFGSFENKNYQELSGCKEYQAWLDSRGTISFPGGEDPKGFRRRCLEGFAKVREECQRDGVHTAACIVHGGTIMSILEAYGRPAGDYYDYQVGNGEGYELMVADDDTGSGRISAGSSAGRSQVDVSSGASDRKADHGAGENYQKLSALRPGR